MRDELFDGMPAQRNNSCWDHGGTHFPNLLLRFRRLARRFALHSTSLCFTLFSSL
jgi:hypothetical protein